MADEMFLRWLRDALNQLYNPAALRANPLFELFGLGQGESASALRRILATAIDALRPSPDVAADSDAWRTYRVLFHRYVQQFGQEVVATNLGLSVRQMQRQSTLALQSLADYLWARYDLQHKSLPIGIATTPQAIGDKAASGTEEVPEQERESTLYSQEMAWLERSSPGKPADVGEVVRGMLETVSPLIEASGVRIEVAMAKGLPRVAIPQDMLRQALLNVFVAAIHSASGGQVGIEAEVYGQQVRVSVQSLPQQIAASDVQVNESDQNLKMARQLLALSGGSLVVAPDEEAGRTFVARLLLPAEGQIIVLVIDDNPDTLRLFQRYLAGSRYAFASARGVEEALAMAEEFPPQIIVLDVMLPEVDGWELLGRLHEHPKIHNTPIIVCTILPQEQLALTLGAAAFLHKPVKRRALLSTLDRQVELLAPGSG